MSSVSMEYRKVTHESFIEASSYFVRALKKYGLENFEWEVLFEGDVPREVLCGLEIQFITEFGTKMLGGYNMTRGGDGFFGSHTEETKRRISVSLSGMRKSDEMKRKCGLIFKGKNHSAKSKALMRKFRLGRTYEELYGKEKAEEIKKAIGSKAAGIPRTEEIKRKISAAQIGVPKSEETKRRMRAAAAKRKRGQNGN